jgi:hypothetical protein
MRTVTGRSTYAIQKKMIVGQRAILGFGGMHTSEAREQGLTEMSRASVDKVSSRKAAAGKHAPADLMKVQAVGVSTWGEKGGILSGLKEAEAVVPLPALAAHWCVKPTQEQCKYYSSTLPLLVTFGSILSRCYWLQTPQLARQRRGAKAGRRLSRRKSTTHARVPCGVKRRVTSWMMDLVVMERF